MRPANLVLAGLAVAGLVGGLAVAQAETKPRLHEITVALPGGGVEHIRYAGDVAPQLLVTSGPEFTSDTGFWVEPSFAQLNRISAEMDRFWSAFDRRMANLVAEDENLFAAMQDHSPLLQASTKTPGSYSYVSEFSMNGLCTRSVSITQQAGDAKPEVVSRTSGDCARSGETPAGERSSGAPKAMTPI